VVVGGRVHRGDPVRRGEPGHPKTMRRAAAAVALVVLAACTSTGGPTRSPSASRASNVPAGIDLVGPSASAAMHRLCHLPALHEHPVTTVGHVPDVVTETEHQVEAVRG